MEKNVTDKHFKKILSAFSCRKSIQQKSEDISSFLIKSNDRVSNLSALIYESCNVLKQTTKSTGCILYLVDNDKKEIYLYYKEAQKHRVKWPICEGRTVAGHVAATKQFVVIEDITKDSKFSEGLAFENAKTAMCLPIMQPDNSCFAVVELYRMFSEPYNETMLQSSLCCLGWIGAAMYETNKKYLLNKQSQLNKKLLSLLQDYFSDSVSLDSTVYEILNLAKTSIFANRCSLYVIKQDHVREDIMMSDMFDEQRSGIVDSRKKVPISLDNIDFPAGFAAQTRNIMNIRDVHKDPRFRRQVDKQTGDLVRSTLCWPLLDKEEVMGVLTVTNKLDESAFNDDDEELFGVFADYCLQLIQFYKLQKKTRYNVALNTIHSALLSKHLKACKHDLMSLTDSHISVLPSGFNEFDWYLTPNFKGIMPNLLFYMINKMSGNEPYDRRSLSDFILSVLQAYRDNPYHNTEHAFTFTHCMYNMILRNRKRFKKTEIMSLLVGSLCHDIDHPGVNNSYLMLTRNPLAEMYADSIIEYHHFFLTKQLIQAKGLFNHLSEEEQSEILDIIKHNILCTDLAVHFRVKAEFSTIVNKDSLNIDNAHHKRLIMGMMMTACDFSGMAKPFPIVRRITGNLYKEFYNQGDCEHELGQNPISMMDRSKSSTQPTDQIQFLGSIVIPCMKLTGIVLKDIDNLEKMCIEAKSGWEELDGFKGRAMVFAKSCNK